MNTNFYLTIMRQSDAFDPRQYYMAIFNATTPKFEPIFTSYLYPDLITLAIIGEAYAKRLSIAYKPYNIED